MLAWAVDDEPPQLWSWDDDKGLGLDVFALIENPQVVKVAWNCSVSSERS
jgi:hypothetical protein